MRHKQALTLSIVIPAYNEERHLTACLDAIAEQTQMPDEVIVVDNNSTDKTARIAKRYKFVTVVAEPKQGRSYARNAGFNAASGDILGRIDADTIMPADWCEHVMEFFSDTRRTKYLWTSGGYFTNFSNPKFMTFVQRWLVFYWSWTLIGHFPLWGSSAALPRGTWIAVRSLTSERQDIHEDLDLSIVAGKRGYKHFYDRSILVGAEMRRMHSNRDELYEYLKWLPRTIRLHKIKTWPAAWAIGVWGIYAGSLFVLLGDKIKALFTKMNAD